MCSILASSIPWSSSFSSKGFAPFVCASDIYCTTVFICFCKQIFIKLLLRVTILLNKTYYKTKSIQLAPVWCLGNLIAGLLCSWDSSVVTLLIKVKFYTQIILFFFWRNEKTLAFLCMTRRRASLSLTSQSSKSPTLVNMSKSGSNTLLINTRPHYYTNQTTIIFTSINLFYDHLSSFWVSVTSLCKLWISFCISWKFKWDHYFLAFQINHVVSFRLNFVYLSIRARSSGTGKY